MTPGVHRWVHFPGARDNGTQSKNCGHKWGPLAGSPCIFVADVLFGLFQANFQGYYSAKTGVLQIESSCFEILDSNTFKWM